MIRLKRVFIVYLNYCKGCDCAGLKLRKNKDRLLMGKCTVDFIENEEIDIEVLKDLCFNEEEDLFILLKPFYGKKVKLTIELLEEHEE